MNKNQHKNTSSILEQIETFEADLQNGSTPYYEESVFLALIDYFEEQGELSKGLIVVDCAIRCYQFSTTFLIRKAVLLANMGKRKRALCLLDSVLDLSPDSLEAYLLQIELLIKERRLEQASLLIENIREVEDDIFISQLYLLESLIFEAKHDYDLMFEALQDALLFCPTNQEALDRVMLCVELSEKYEASLVLHQELIDVDPFNAKAWYNLGRAYDYLSEYEKALEAYEYAFLIDENFEFAYRDYAELCLNIKRYQAALNCYEEVLELFDADEDLYLKMGQCEFHLGNTSKAINWFTHAYCINNRNDEVLYHLGNCFAQQADWSQAVNCYKKAIQYDGRREEYYMALSAAYEQLGDMDDAITAYRKAIETAPEQSNLWIAFIRFLFKLKDYAEVNSVIEEATFYTTSAELSFCKAANHLIQGDTQQAFAEIKHAVQYEEAEAELLFELMPSLREDKAIKLVMNNH